tara:strand:+ start:106 stop:1026 length:921 start_codon:yes stop_codon:yes gene_type:complete
MKYNILITDILIKDFVNIFEKDFKVECLWQLNKNINFNKYQAIVVTGGFNTDKNFLKKINNLKIVSVFGVGYDGVDLNYCEKNNITVTNTPKVLTNDVADLALGLMIGLSRKINESHQFIIGNNWIKKPFHLTNSLSEKIVGIVGLGEIGKAFAKRAKSLSMKVVYTGPNKKNSQLKFYKNLSEMVKKVDYLVLTCIGGKSTKSLINKKILGNMKQTSMIINVSRGSVINEDDLIYSLQNKKIAGAALDVFDKEPKINNKLKKLKNILLSPHNASATFETRNKMAILSKENIKDLLIRKRKKNFII